jgi:hypothetical protein
MPAKIKKLAKAVFKTLESKLNFQRPAQLPNASAGFFLSFFSLFFSLFFIPFKARRPTPAHPFPFQI